MEYKILESPGVEIEGIDGAALNHASVNYQNGYLKGVLNECQVYSPDSSLMYVSTGVLIIQGIRVKITSPYSVKIPLSVGIILYHLVAQLTVSSSGSMSFNIVCRPLSELTKDEILSVGFGTYEIELARITAGSSGIIDYSKTIYEVAKPPEDGFSPTVSIEPIENGHQVTITDINGDHSFDVMNGAKGERGASIVAVRINENGELEVDIEE